MLDAFIIEKLKKERERKQEEWQPIPLPLERYPKEDKEPEQPPRKEKTEYIRF